MQRNGPGRMLLDHLVSSQDQRQLPKESNNGKDASHNATTEAATSPGTGTVPTVRTNVPHV